MRDKALDDFTELRTPPDSEGPLRRWARRKREAAPDARAEADARRSTGSDEASASGGEDAEALGQVQPAESAVAEEKALTDEDMPPLGSLDENSDYSGFLSPGVSEGLRRRALRKLFFSAAFNVRDGLDDYDEDFTSFEALGDIVTSDMKHQAEMEAERTKRVHADVDTEPEPAVGSGEEADPAQDGRPVHADDETTGLAEAEGAPAQMAAPAERTTPADAPTPVGLDPSAGTGHDSPPEAAAASRTTDDIEVPTTTGAAG